MFAANRKTDRRAMNRDRFARDERAPGKIATRAEKRSERQDAKRQTRQWLAGAEFA